MAHTSNDAEIIEQDGLRWFIGAAIVAILFCILLYRIDWGLANWDVEVKRAQTIGELRKAQTTIPTGESDPRTTGSATR